MQTECHYECYQEWYSGTVVDSNSDHDDFPTNHKLYRIELLQGEGELVRCSLSSRPRGITAVQRFFTLSQLRCCKFELAV